MGVHAYRKMIAEADGVEGPVVPDGWTHKDFNWKSDQNEWDATVYFENEVPKHFAYYIWSCSEENFAKGVLEAIGTEYKLVNDYYGNGHGDATVVPR